MQYMCVNSKENGVMRMMSVMGSSCFCSKTSSRLKSGVRFWGGGGQSVICPLQVCAAERKVLSIK